MYITALSRTQTYARDVSSYSWARPTHSPWYVLLATGILSKRLHPSYWENLRFVFVFWCLIKIPTDCLGDVFGFFAHFSVDEKVIENASEPQGRDLCKRPHFACRAGHFKEGVASGCKEKECGNFRSDFKFELLIGNFITCLSLQCSCGFLYFLLSCVSKHLVQVRHCAFRSREENW